MDAVDEHLDDIEYRGETRARKPHVATLAAILCPGLAYLYVGRLTKGVTVNLLFVFLVELFIILMSWLKFFPLLPLLVLVASWITFGALIALDVREIIREEDFEHEYVLEPFNHWLIYSLVAVLTLVAPILASVEVTERYMITAAPVRNASMYPTLLPGDVVLIDRHGFDATGQRRGDIVAVSANKPGAPVHVLRVVGLQGDVIRVEGDMLYLNDEPVERVPLDLAAHGVETGGLLARSDMLAMIERNRDERYVISMSRATVTKTSIAPTQLEEGEMFLLADNRSQVPLDERHPRIRDSRNFGALDLDKLRGKPLYILWSSGEDGVRWERVGIKLQ